MRNEKPVRKSALISPWGAGAIVPVASGETFMIAGLKFWFDKKHAPGPENKSECYEIEDSRLSERLGGKKLVQPPEFQEKRQGGEYAETGIPAIRFPRTYYCPVCGNIEELGEAVANRDCPGDNRRGREGGTFCSKRKAAGKHTPKMVPERFVAICENGHIEDFPIAEWVHRKSEKIYDPEKCKMYRSTGSNTASLTGIRYTCTCGASATMKGAFEWDEENKESALGKIGIKCHGKAPWLGATYSVACDKPLRVVQRGASNVWFPDIISSIYIPEVKINSITEKCIKKVSSKIESQRKNGCIDEEIVKIHVDRYAENVDDDDMKVNKQLAVEKIIAGFETKTDDSEKTEDYYRKAEYDVLIDNYGNEGDELIVRKHESNEYEKLWFLNSVSLVSKLRETRVLTGFRRVSPQAPQARLSEPMVGWFPAVKNNGEGIMFCFDTEALNKWAIKNKVLARVEKIKQNIKYSCGKCKDINPIYVLIHTFSHCLITALSEESGYSASSIRERIYCPKFRDENSIQMAGVLIYTSSGDSEGSLGGLVRQGRPGRIEETIRHALREAEWCSADPVCIQSGGQGIDGANLAACHNCALIPETSCENRNTFLDRGLLIGTLEDKSIGFFNYGKEN